MIYNRASLIFLFSFIASLGLFKRLSDYLSFYFQKQYAVLIAVTILLHPLSIEAIIGPNILNGTVAFWFFLESLFLLKQEREEFAIAYAIAASLCNISYSLIPIYYFFKFKQRRKYFFVIFIYMLLLLSFYWNLIILPLPNPLHFITYFLQLIILPQNLSVLSPETLPFSWLSFIIFLLFFLMLYLFRKKISHLQDLLFFLALPLIGYLMIQWTKPKFFGAEVFFSSSSFLCITFSVITLFANLLPRKIFISFTIMTLLFSYNWFSQWNSISNVIKYSIGNLPADFSNTFSIRRMLALQLIDEEKYYEAKVLLLNLQKEFPDSAILKSDIEVLNMNKLNH